MNASEPDGFTVVVHHSTDDHVYYAHIPTLGIVTEGDSVEHAFEMAAEAISLRVELAREAGETLPIEDESAHVRLVTV